MSSGTDSTISSADNGSLAKRSKKVVVVSDATAVVQPHTSSIASYDPVATEGETDDDESSSTIKAAQSKVEIPRPVSPFLQKAREKLGYAPLSETANPETANAMEESSAMAALDGLTRFKGGLRLRNTQTSAVPGSEALHNSSTTEYTSAGVD